MNFMKGSLFHRSTELEEVEITQESGGGVLAVWGSPGCGKTVTAVKIAKHLASQKKNVALLLCDMTAPMMPCICPPSELECDKSLGSIFAAQRISVNLIKHNLTTHKKLSYLTENLREGHPLGLGSEEDIARFGRDLGFRKNSPSGIFLEGDIMHLGLLRLGFRRGGNRSSGEQ